METQSRMEFDRNSYTDRSRTSSEVELMETEVKGKASASSDARSRTSSEVELMETLWFHVEFCNFAVNHSHALLRKWN